jgi:hypothetical protein
VKEIREPTNAKCTRYEIFWERDPALKEVIDSSWKDLGRMDDLGSINQGLELLMKSLQTWRRKKFGNVTRVLKKLREKLADLQASHAPRAKIREVTDMMNETLYREEILWLQRSRVDW